VVYLGIILNGSYVDIYLTSYDTILYATCTILECDNIGIVVVAEEVTVHLTMILRRAEYVVNITHRIALKAYNLIYPLAKS
jgi:hypothetical protein